MKIFVKIIIFSFILVTLCGANNLPDWFVKNSTDIDTLLKKANQEHKSVMLFFDEEGCPWCKKMVKENFQDPKFAKFIRQKFMIIHIDNFGDREVLFKGAKKRENIFRKELKIVFSPTMLFLDEKGDIVAIFPGYKDRKKFKSIIDYILSKAYKRYSYEEYLTEREFK